MAAYLSQEWDQLIGVFVEVRQNRRCVRAGYVDDAMPDASALWIAADESGSRVLIAKAEGYEVWVDPPALPAAVAYRVTASALRKFAT